MYEMLPHLQLAFGRVERLGATASLDEQEAEMIREVRWRVLCHYSNIGVVSRVEERHDTSGQKHSVMTVNVASMLERASVLVENTNSPLGSVDSPEYQSLLGLGESWEVEWD